MEALSVYDPIRLTAKQKVALQQMMADAFVVLSEAGRPLGMSPKALRRVYKRDESVLGDNPIAKEHMEKMIAAEPTIVRGYIGMGCKMCLRYEKVNEHGLSFDDYIQECAMAIHSSQYVYNGRTQFSTFAYTSMCNAMVNMVRYDETKKSARTLMLAGLVKDFVEERWLSTEEAIEEVRKSKGVTDKEVGLLRDAIRCVRVTGFNEPRAQEPEDDQNEDRLDAVRSAKLNELQRLAVDEFLRNGQSFAQAAAAKTQNPVTEKPYSKNIIRKVFKEACEIIRGEYGRKTKVA